MKKIFLFILTLTTLNFAFSQNDFREGFIVTNNRDTVRGFLNYRKGAKSYALCTFKESKNQSPTTYTAKDITSYGFTGYELFESREIIAEDGFLKVVFFEVLIKGSVNLYKLEARFWVEKEGHEMQPLINSTQEVFVNGKRFEKKNYEYIITLGSFLFDCDEVRGYIQKTTLRETPLIKLIQEYNRCIGNNLTLINYKKDLVNIRLGITAGLNISKIKFKTDGASRRLDDQPFDVSLAPTIGLTLSVNSPRVSEHLSLFTSINYLKQRYSKYSLLRIGNTYSESHDISIDIPQLKVPVGIRYTFSERKFTPYINLALSSTFHLNPKSSWTHQIESTSNQYSYLETKEALVIKNMQLGCSGSLGISRSFNKNLLAILEIGYEYTNGIASGAQVSGLEVISSKITNFYINLGLRIK